MTGGSSGFGAIAVRQLAQASGTPPLVGARSPKDGSVRLDLTSMDSVRAFSGSVRERLGETRIDALVLNAGTVLPDDTRRSTDGYKTTFAVNHLAHYLLIRLLMPALADRARVVLTTSGTHDPTTGASLQTPRHADADLLAHPHRDPGRHSRPKKAASTPTPRPNSVSCSPRVRCTHTPTSRPGTSRSSPTTRARCSAQGLHVTWRRTCGSPGRCSARHWAPRCAGSSAT